MSDNKDLLIEIGTEELPPKSLKHLATSFEKELCQLLKEQDLNFEQSKWYATPRRLAVIISQLQVRQTDKEQQRKGPSLKAAYDEDGKPTNATEGFAKSCGTTIDKLEKLETDKGSWLIFNTVVKGQETSSLLQDMINTALKRLPIAKRMRWGNYDREFVRPVKWLMVLMDNEIVDCEIMGQISNRYTYGHRFHTDNKITINQADEYVSKLEKEGKVIADYEARRSRIREQVELQAKSTAGEAIIEQALLDEVTALVEWPNSFLGNFNPDFLKLPKEVLMASMQDHQKYFPVLDSNNKLLPNFIFVSNIESHKPELVQQGNERVLQPRLNDAVFFWERDLKHGLAKHIPSLKKVVYQKQLGTLYDKSQRIKKSIIQIIDSSIDTKQAERASELCLCDLLSEMVYEFPELQGTMGRHYAEADGEPEAVSIALEEFYQPRFAGDDLPSTKLGQYLSICEKVDSLIGIFAIGKKPTGDKDPFGLRRSAIGVLRIIIECSLDLDLKQLISVCANNYPETIKAQEAIDDVLEFMLERLRRYYIDNGYSADTVDSVMSLNISQPLDFHQRLMAVDEFRKLEAAQSLAAANKRIANIIKKYDEKIETNIDDELLKEEAEIKLAKTLANYRKKLEPILDNKDYQAALMELAGLRDDVDGFFDNVMVMCDDTDLKRNRLALLNSLSTLFLAIADISKLQG